MMTEASNDKDMYIDWDKVHSGDELETQRAIESVEALCWWVLDRRAPGWRANRWDEDDIKQQMRLSLLRGTRWFDPEKGKWSSYAGRIAHHLARDIRDRLIWPIAGTVRQANHLNGLYANAEDPKQYEPLRGALASLDASVNPTGDTCLGEFMISPETEEWEDVVCEQLDIDRLLGKTKLTELESTALLAMFVLDMPYSAITAQYGIHHKAIDNALRRAKGKLRKVYRETAVC